MNIVIFLLTILVLFVVCVKIRNYYVFKPGTGIKGWANLRRDLSSKRNAIKIALEKVGDERNYRFTRARIIKTYTSDEHGRFLYHHYEVEYWLKKAN